MKIDVDKAVGLLEARMKDNPKSLVFARLADLYLEQGRVEDALTICIESTKVHPYYATGHFVLAKAYIAKKDLEKAETALKKVLSHDQQYPAAQKLLGDILCKTNRDSLAIGHYEAVILMDPLEEKVQKALDRIPREPVKPAPSLSLSPSPSPSPPKAEPVVRPRIQPVSEHQDESWVDQIKEIRPEEKTRSVEERQTFAPSENEIADPFAELVLFGDKEKSESPETQPDTGDEDMQTFIQDTAEKSLDVKAPDAGQTDSEAGSFIGETSFDLRHKHEDSPVPLHFSENLSEPAVESDSEQTPEPEPSPSPSPDMPISSQAKTTELFPETEMETEEPVPKDVGGFHAFYNEPGILDDVSLAAEPTILDDFPAAQKPPVEPPVEEIESDLSSIFAEPLPPAPSKPPAAAKPEAKPAVKPEPKIAEPAEPTGEKKLPKIVTPTLGEIYAAQGQYDKAIQVYETLLEKNPNEKKYVAKIEEMKKKIKEAAGR